MAHETGLFSDAGDAGIGKDSKMHAARLDHSGRLRRVVEVLSDGREHTTYEIVHAAQVCAVNSIIAELRANGFRIACHRRGDRWYYRMEGRDG